MKIIKRGTPPSEEVWVGKCNRCFSEAEAPRSELTNITAADYRSEAHSWETCPVCNAGCGKPCWGGMLFYKKKDSR